MPPPRRTAPPLTAALVLLVLLWGGAAAQKVQLTGGAPAVFAPTSDDILAAIGCAPPDCIEPLPPATTLKLIRQQRNNQPVLRGSRTAWSPTDDLELWARYTVDGNQSSPFATGWFEIGTSPVEMFGTTDPNTSVTVEYQLRLGLDAAAGSYQTTVFYDAGPGSRGVEHLVTVGVVPVIGLRIDGAPVGAEATVAFDYLPSPLVYLDAITTGALLPPTGGDLTRVEVFSNSPGGYRVTVAVDQVANLDGNLFPADALLLAGAPAPTAEFSGPDPTDGYLTLLTADDYRLSVDGDEEPGAYRLTLTFTAEILP
jgi:hypothetical protein